MANPEQRTHDSGILTDNFNANKTALDTARNSYIESRNRARSIRSNNIISRFFDRKARRKTPDEQLKISQESYEKAVMRQAQLEARRAIDAIPIPVGNPAAVEDSEYRRLLSEKVAEIVIKEKKDIVNAEVDRNDRNGFARAWRRVSNNPLVRTAVGLGLNVAIGASMAAGAWPFSALLIGARVGFGAWGIAGGLKSAENIVRGEGVLGIGGWGGRRNMNGTEVAAETDINVIARRIAALTEARINNRNNTPSNTEQLLWDRYKELIKDQVKNQLTAENVSHWKRHEREAATQDAIKTVEEANITTHETKRADAGARGTEAMNKWELKNTEADQKQKEIDDKITARDEKHNKALQVRREEGELVKQAAEKGGQIDPKKAQMDKYDKVISDDGTVGKLVPGTDRDEVLAACEEYVDALTRIRSSDPVEKMFAESEKRHAERVLNDATKVADKDMVLAAFGRKIKLIKEVETLEKEMEDLLNKAQEKQIEWRKLKAERDTLHGEVAPLEVQRDAARTEAENWLEYSSRLLQRAANKESLRDASKIAAENAANNALSSRTLSKEQAVLVHDILLGGEGLEATDVRPAIAARPKEEGVLEKLHTNELSRTEHTHDRRWRMARWALALAASGVLTVLTIPNVVPVKFDGVDPLYPHINNGGVSSLWGQAEAAWITQFNPEFQPGIPVDLSNAEHTKWFNEQFLPTHPEVARKLYEYHHFVTMNNPDALYVDPSGRTHADLIVHGREIMAPNPQTFFRDPAFFLEQTFRDANTARFDHQTPTAWNWVPSVRPQGVYWPYTRPEISTDTLRNIRII